MPVMMSSAAAVLDKDVASPGIVQTGFVDAHAHLIHKQFIGEEDDIAANCRASGLDYVIVNGLEPSSNRAVLDLCARHSNLLPAAGIYPLNAACGVIATHPDVWAHSNTIPPPKVFDVDAEIAFIASLAAEGRITAIGECGLDGHYLTDALSMRQQERVLRQLMRIGVQHDIPLILHSRKAEQRVLELLLEENVKKADIHCFCGKVRLRARIN
jgi:TatD DNase family protein